MTKCNWKQRHRHAMLYKLVEIQLQKHLSNIIFKWHIRSNIFSHNIARLIHNNCNIDTVEESDVLVF